MKNSQPPKSVSVLLVDDDDNLRKLLNDLLSHRGHPVTDEATLAGLRSRLNGPGPAVLLLDLHLGDGNALSVLPEIKTHWPSTRVIIITGHGTVEAAEQAYAQGDLFLLSKPFDGEMLQAVMDLALA